MPDPRFYDDLGPVTLIELAAVTGAKLARPEDGERRLAAVAPLVRAGASDLSFFADRRYLDDLRATRAGACFVAGEFAEAAPENCAVLITAEPHAAYAAAANRLHRPRRADARDPLVHPDAVIEDEVSLAQGVTIGAGAHIGRGSIIGAYSVIGPGVAIGRGCSIGSHVTLGFALLGDRVTVLSGAVIGEPGFGVTVGRGRAVDVPQLGRVIIQDNVSIGANSCIDRGAWDDTVIGENTKIDNLVQVAHNVQLGRNCVLAAHTGISGSVVAGDGVQFGGRAGIADHVTIGDGARVAAAAGVMKDIAPGGAVAGLPAKPVRQHMREVAWLGKMAQRREVGDKE
ncbi:MAG: UDP-3-O-(3-hydroxymyristoyl)glucosamine N-acyltransferase [Caulobacteraceae bacterium]